MMIFFASGAQASEWTFMVYIGGDNSLSDAAISDIEEMRKATSSANINVVVQAELSRQYSFNLPSYMTDYNTYRLVIRNGQVQSIPLGTNLDMANPDTLKGFIQWGASAYPANKYVLVIWDHGAGWKDSPAARFDRGAVEDTTSGTFMSLAQLGKGVKDSGVHINLLNFDACLMAMYEVAYEFKGYVDYLVASEEVEPGAGNPYTAILNELSASPSMSVKDLSQVFVSKYIDSYKGTKESATLSAVDVTQMQALNQLILDFVNTVRSNLSAYWSSLSLARDKAQHYYYKSNTDMVSFLDYMKNAGGDAGTKAANLSNFISNNVVVYNGYYTAQGSGVVSGSNVDGSKGLAVFFPNSATIQQGEMSAYAALSSNTGQQNSWYSLVNDFLNFAGGGTGGITMVPAAFAIGAAWTDNAGHWGDANVDLYIAEPDGSVGSPWLGQSTSNGYFSSDAPLTAGSYEIYTSKATVMAGDYYVFLNYFSDGYYDNFANVYMYYMDYLSGVNSWTLIPGQYLRVMSFNNPAPYIWTNAVIKKILNNYYSDWWIPGYLTKAISQMPFEKQIKMLTDIKRRAELKGISGNWQNLLGAIGKH